MKATNLKLGVATIFAALTLTACPPMGPKQIVKTVLDVATYTCVIANADFPSPKIAQVCGIADDLIPVLQVILNDLAVHDERAQARYAAAHCEEIRSSTPPVKK